jgi:DNA-binding LacI/PurR family transcriptional regulator
MAREPSPVSIADVARRAKVSISTVSRVLNRPDVVNAKTRARVERAINTLGYRPNLFARGLMLRRSELIGLILPDLHGEFYSEVIRGADQQARSLGYHLVVSASQESDDDVPLLGTLTSRTLVDGLAIMVADVTDSLAETLGTLRQPFVLLDADLENAPHDSVIIDQAHGARALVRHLLTTCGCRRVIFVGGEETNVDSIARLAACREVLEEAGLPFDPTDVHHLDYTYETALEHARRHVRQWAGSTSAVFAANDEMAAGIVAAARDIGVRVPEQLRVVGFDDTRMARMTSPPLTTVRVPMAQMGARAVELVIQRLAEPDRAPERVSLRPELIVRQSCGCPAAVNAASLKSGA